MRPKDDALLFEDVVARTGGDGTSWARAVRRGLAHDADELRQRHREEMRQRFEDRGRSIVALLLKTSGQRTRDQALDEPKRSRRLAAIAAFERRELERIDTQFALESFVAWSVRRRKEIERGALVLDRAAAIAQRVRAERSEQRNRTRLDRDKAERAQSVEARPMSR